MKDLQSQLRLADPLAREGGMTRADVERMRRQVLSAAREPVAAAGNGLSLALAATLVVASIGGAWLTHAAVSQPAVSPSRAAVPGVSEQPIRQLQFSTPGGTRVIWTFNPNFQVR